MALHHPVAAELDSTTTDSVASTPRSEHHHLLRDDAPQQQRVRFMCSFGGQILPRPHDNQLRYVGGDTRIVAVHRHTSFSSLLSKLAKLSGTTDISVKYQLPSEDLDALISVTTDEDVENMMDEYDRFAQNHKSARLRLFLFPSDSDSRANSISSLLDGSAKRENWFVDALNGGAGTGPGLERGRSEVSSIVSEVPDYLFGLDNSDDALKEAKLKNKNLVNDNVSISDPGSPAPVVSSPFCSTSSSLAPQNVQAMPDLPPVRTKPVNPVQLAESREIQAENIGEVINEKMGPQQTGYTGGSMWHYPGPPVQHVPAVYYLPGHVQPGNIPVQIRAPYVQPYPVTQSQVSVGYGQPMPNVGQVYGPGMRQYEIPATTARVIPDNASQTMYYAARNVGMVPGSYQGVVLSGGEEAPGPGADGLAGRVSQNS